MCQVPGKVPKSEKEERREGGRRKEEGKEATCPQQCLPHIRVCTWYVCVCACARIASHTY